jgi:hypothetical protein
MNFAHNFATQPGVNLRKVQDVRPDIVHFTGQESMSSSSLSGKIIFVIDSRANPKYHCTEEVSCETVSVMHVAQLLLSLCSPDAEESLLRGSHFENFVTPNGSSEQYDLAHLKLNFGSLSTDACKVKYKLHSIF